MVSSVPHSSHVHNLSFFCLDCKRLFFYKINVEVEHFCKHLMQAIQKDNYEKNYLKYNFACIGKLYKHIFCTVDRRW
jgi:hypothetical protein